MRSHAYLAVDIGASSGRHIIGFLQDGILKTEEVYRFSNTIVKREGTLCWELDRLFEEILSGLSACRERGIVPVSMGIDTWGVDFVLLDKDCNILGDTVCYRDSRTDGMDEYLSKVISDDALYAKTGIQKQKFNTIYQLCAIKSRQPELLEKAEHFLMIPDYFHFLLTGVLSNEYTNATTTQLVNAAQKNWDYDLIEQLGLPVKLFKELKLPKASLGMLLPGIAEKVGFQTEVVLPATHDTGSAVAAVPMRQGKNSVFISSGTWSLIGIERAEADCGDRSCRGNFSNEGGYDYRFRYLKNVMGLWMIQSVRNELDRKHTFDELCELAIAEKEFPSRVDVLDDAFLAPENMGKAVVSYCEKTGQRIPETVGQLVSCIYHSLADCYAKIIMELEEITGLTLDTVHIVGGGCNDRYLNTLTEQRSGKTVLAGPSEATAIGNILVQMIQRQEIDSLEEARQLIARSAI